MFAATRRIVAAAAADDDDALRHCQPLHELTPAMALCAGATDDEPSVTWWIYVRIDVRPQIPSSSKSSTLSSSAPYLWRSVPQALRMIDENMASIVEQISIAVRQTLVDLPDALPSCVQSYMPKIVKHEADDDDHTRNDARGGNNDNTIDALPDELIAACKKQVCCGVSMSL